MYVFSMRWSEQKVEWIGSHLFIFLGKKNYKRDTPFAEENGYFGHGMARFGCFLA